MITIKDEVYYRAVKYHRSQKKDSLGYSNSFSRDVTNLLDEILKAKGY